MSEIDCISRIDRLRLKLERGWLVFYVFFTLTLQETRSTRVIFYVRRKVDLMKTAKVNAYIMHIFGKIELLSIHAT